MAAPELRLNVTLDLAAFRGQLDKLAQEAGARYFGVKLSIDGTDFRKQLKNLEKIKPVITINDSQLIAARERIGTLNKSLATLRRATATPIEIKIKYVEVGKPPSGGTAQIGKAVSGGVRGSQAIEGFSRSQLQSTRKAMVGAGMSVGEMGNLAKASTDEYKKSIIQGFTNSGQEAINGLAAGLKDSSSKIAQAASKVGEQGVRGIKDALGIASPSKVFRQIGEFSVDGLELGFLNGLKDFKNKSISEVRTIVALLKLEFAKIKDIGGAGGPTAGSLRQKLVGNRAYSAPIGPQPIGSTTPYARGDRGQFGHTGYEPRMVSRLRGQAPTADSNSFLQFSRNAAQVQPLPGTQGSFRGFSQRATQVQQAAGGGVGVGGGGVPPSGGGGVPPRSGGGGAFAGMQFAMPKLPGTGIVQALGTEFSFAAKQVLLFGAAYKALAFLTDFPSKVGEAVGQLQSFRNTIKAISPTANEAAQSSQFILDVVDKYNVPLQSARDGFTKLYASMQPAGFNGGEIRDLFLGISQAAATFGMSADKVDRVNYAFAQMASKGQIMSEELKGQLGDVLPGAMSIFAEAAGFKGPKAIQDFSKALEDGAYKGGAMKTLLTNVGTLMRKEFGPGAEGAARTFQGSMNRMQNSLKLFYETFEPVAVGFLNAVVMPITSGIKTLTDGFNAFFTGQAAQTAGGNVLAQQLEQLRPAFDGIRNNIAQILPLLQSFGKTALSLGSILLQIAGNPFVGYLARVYLAVLPLTIAIQALNLSALIPLIRNLLAAVPAFVAFTASQLRGMSTLGSFKAATYGLGLTAAATGVKIRLLSGIIKTAFATTVIGVALLGIGMLIEKLMMAGIKADEAKQKMLQFADSVKQAGKAGDVSGLTTTLAEEKGDAKRMQNAKALLEEIKKGKKSISEQQKQELQALGLASNMAFFKEGGPKNLSKNLTVQVSGLGVLDANIQAAQQGYNEGQTRILQSQRALNVAKSKQVKEEKELEKIDLSGSDKDKKTSLESYYNLEDQLAKASTQAEIDRAQMIFDHQTKLMNLGFDLREARANSFQKDAIRFQRELAQIEQERANAMFKARSDVVMAGGRVAGGAAGTGGATGSTGLLQGSTGISSGPHFDVRRQDGSYISERQARALFDQSVNSQLTMTSPYGPRTAPTPGASSFHRGVDLAGKANTPLNLAAGYSMTGAGEKGGLGYAASIRGPAGEMYDVGHLQRPSAGAGAARKVPGSEGRVIKAEQEQEIALRNQKLTGMQQEEFYYKRIEVAIANYAASIFSPEEQQLQNNLLEKRNNLIKQGASKDVIDFEMERYEMQEKFKNGIEVANKKIEENNALVSEGRMSQEKATEQNAIHNNTIEKLTKNLNQVNPLLERKNKLTKDDAFFTAMASLKNRLAIAKAPTEDAARREELKQEGYRDDEIPRMMAIEEEMARLGELKQKSSDIASSISESITGAFKNIVTGSMAMQEALAGSFRSIGDFFADMVMKMIADYLKLSMLQGIKNILSMFAPGASAGGGFALGGAGGQGAAGSYGSAMSATSSLPSFTGGGGFQPVSMGNFGVAPFANGGMVTGPTLGLVGEGRYNEAIIPLPDGKSVPVQLAGGTEGATAPINTNIVVNVKNGQSDSQVTGNQGNQLGREIEGAVRQVILKEIRPGGIIYGSR